MVIEYDLTSHYVIEVKEKEDIEYFLNMDENELAEAMVDCCGDNGEYYGAELTDSGCGKYNCCMYEENENGEEEILRELKDVYVSDF